MFLAAASGAVFVLCMLLACFALRRHPAASLALFAIAGFAIAAGQQIG